MNAKNESYCICTDEYTGDLCEKKTGCYGDPCKHGKCTNDPKDLAKFTCQCEAGIVGPKCDTSELFLVLSRFWVWQGDLNGSFSSLFS